MEKEFTKVSLKLQPIPPLIIGLCLIVCALIVRSTLIQIRSFGRTIQVTGAAFKPITSDFAIWEAKLQCNSTDLATGYAQLKRDLELTRAFMSENGFKDNQYQIGTVQTSQMFDREGRPTQCSLTQPIKIELADVPRIGELGRRASSLVEKGVNLGFQNIRYVYTGIEDVKIEMIKAATENAKIRAEQLASTTGQKVGAPTNARVGVFQIRALHTQEVSDYGMNDVTSIEKEVVCTVQISFMID